MPQKNTLHFPLDSCSRLAIFRSMWTLLDQIGVAVFAISGCLAAGRKQLDWVGALALAIVTSIGGGTFRDILLNRDTLFWIADPSYLWIILAATMGTIFATRFIKPPMNTLMVADALGLALFTILGAQIAESEGVAPVVIVVMGVLTGVTGGIIRDILTGEIPHIFRPTEPLYSVAALSGAALYVVAQHFGSPSLPAALAGMLLIATLRLAAMAWKIRLPAYRLPQK